MRSSLKQALRLMTRRSRSGQSIVIIALGFIALIAFVGIATDTAVLFVRYSTLRRAVDAAAVAAAGEVRQNANYSTMVAAAQEYIRIHGLDPTSVIVDTCETEIYNYDKAHPGRPTPPTTHDLLVTNHSELCTATPTKLVRVSAQILSPTSFLGIIGYKSVLLSASSLSQTAVMDVAIMLDASQSMSGDTTSDAFSVSQSGGSTALDSYAPMLALGLGPYSSTNQPGWTTGSAPNGTIRAQCRNTPTTPSNINGHRGVSSPPDHSVTTPPDTSHSYSNYAWGGCCDEPATMSLPPGTASEQAKTNWFNDQYTGAITTAHIINGDNPENTNPEPFKGITPGIDYGALICKPFQDVRTSARNFLNKVDFMRGDRVMLITFDSDIHALTVNGDSTTSTTLPVFTSRTDAIYALNRYAGVQNYALEQKGGCASYNREPYGNVTNVYETIANCTDTNTGGAIQAMQSLMTDPRWIRRDAVWIGVLMSDGYPNRTPGLSNVSGNGVAGPEHPNIHIVGSPAYVPAGNLYYGNFFKPALPPGSSDADPGFCPWNTFCDKTGHGYNSDRSLAPFSYNDGASDPLELDNIATAANGYNTYYPNMEAYNNLYCQATDVQPDPIWWSTATNGAYQASADPSLTPKCTANDPDVRHFCMDPSTGVINPLNANPALCSLHYDATDFARDRTDFAALIDYTSAVKGNFIAMFSIFYPHNTTANIGSYILGAKFMRYVADAGDNGVIDNHLQQWYRANNNAPDPATLGTFPGYNGSTFGTGTEDPCAQYDFRETGDLPGSLAYESKYKINCGNYYYAGTTNAVNVAFTDIASRLFTRLTR